jgi:hypothetical protein
MGLKALIPFTAAKAQRGHVKYLRRKARGHDVLLLVEWDDGQLTELGADYHPDKDGWYEATNGLMFAAVGDGADTVDYYGVPAVKCHAGIACPFSTTACLQAEYDDIGEFEYQTDDGKTTGVIEVEQADQPDGSAGPTANGHAGNGESESGLLSDGGARMKRQYDIRPPAGAVGHAFGLDQAKQRAPYPVSANMLRKAVEIGKQSERDQGQWLRMFLYGAGLVVAVLVILAILYIIGASILGGGGGGGQPSGGGGTTLGMLGLLAGTARHSVWRHLTGGRGDQ